MPIIPSHVALKLLIKNRTDKITFKTNEALNKEGILSTIRTNPGFSILMGHSVSASIQQCGGTKVCD
jgi:hypothetical protein